MMAAIIQWNCRGLRANFNEIHFLASNYKPSVICLQETKCKINAKPSIKNFSCYTKNHSGTIAHGGVAILIADDTPHRHLQLNTNLQAVAAHVSLININL